MQVFEALREYSVNVNVDWVLGNHDPSAAWFSGLLGIKPCDEVTLDINGAPYLIYHGHGWDPSMRWPQLIVDAADKVYFACQWGRSFASFGAAAQTWLKAFLARYRRTQNSRDRRSAIARDCRRDSGAFAPGLRDA